MDSNVQGAAAGQDASIHFEGDWREYLGIALVNLLLTIVTIGIYRFWAKTRSRQYLWSRTVVMGEPLEYTGTGLQLFLGALIAVFAVLLPFYVLITIAQVLTMSGHAGIAALIYLVLTPGMLYLLGVGLYRSQRYLLAQTSWRGIRGGMTTGGWLYGASYLARTLVAALTLLIASPWAESRLWNERWRDARFGSLTFAADAPAGPLMGRFVLTLVGCFAAIGFFMVSFTATLKALGAQVSPLEMGAAAFFGLIWMYVLLMAALWVITLPYRAFYWRHLVSHMGLDSMKLRFNATAWDWARFMLGNVAMVVLTLGLGLIMLPYRSFAFAVRHLEAEGALSPQAIAQSRLAQPGQGEGIADAFDLSPV